MSETTGPTPIPLSRRIGRGDKIYNLTTLEGKDSAKLTPLSLTENNPRIDKQIAPLL